MAQVDFLRTKLAAACSAFPGVSGPELPGELDQLLLQRTVASTDLAYPSSWEPEASVVGEATGSKGSFVAGQQLAWRLLGHLAGSWCESAVAEPATGFLGFGEGGCSVEIAELEASTGPAEECAMVDQGLVQ